MTDNLFANHTEAKRLMITENEGHTINYLNKINDEPNSCQYLLDDNQFKYSLNLLYHSALIKYISLEYLNFLISL